MANGRMMGRGAMSNETIEYPIEEFRLLVDLAGVARNPRLGADVAPLIGGSARATAARRSHDRAKRVLREAEA